MSQIERTDYISTNSIKNIQFSQLPKRKSTFEKNLLIMQQLGQQQQQKYSMMKDGTYGNCGYDAMQPEPFMNCIPLSLDD